MIMKERYQNNMRIVSFDHLFESDMAKLAKLAENSNSEKIQTLKRMVSLVILEELSDRQREVLDMYFNQKMNFSQIARTLKVNKSTVSRIKTCAFNKIRRILKYYNVR